MEPSPKSPAGIAFGRFRLLPHRRALLADGQPTGLGARAFDVLMTLIEARGAAVSKDALAARVWPGQFIQDTALQSQISALRAVLGADRDLIRTVSGRGYQFVGEIRDDRPPRADAEGAGAVTPQPEPRGPPTNLPGSVSELIGRDKELAEIEALVANHRLVTLTGTGGIGKTRLAAAVARQLMPRFGDGVWIVDFSSVSDASLVPATIAAAAGLDSGGTTSRQRVAQALAARRLLLVLDTCEHVVGAVAAMAEDLLRAGPAVHVLATSREPLRAEGEWIFPVLPLTVPAEDAGDDELSHYGAVRLFIERAQATDLHFAPGPANAAAIAAICLRLDGIPLAIELAAARTAAFGVEQLVAHLNDRFHLLTGGRRTALPRHQTLRATLDWSNELLLEPERVVLRRLAVFSGVFSLEAASAVAADSEITPSLVIQNLSDLVAKSLVVAEMNRVTHYRLLDTTRVYALEKLVENGEREHVARRHAEYYRDLFQRASSEVEARPSTEWLAEYRPKLDNLRRALTWAFAPGGNTAIGIDLAVASVPIWFELSLFSECCGWMEASLEALEGPERSPAREMVLRCALGCSLMFAQGTNDRARAELARSAELAAELGNLDYRLRALLGLASICHRLQDFHGAVALGREAEEAVASSSDPISLSMADWILGVSLQLLAKYAEALTYAERTYERTAAQGVRRAHVARLGRDSFISAGGTLALVHWTMGFPDQAARTAKFVLAEAEAGGHTGSVCLALTWSGSIIPLRLGDLTTAGPAIARLKERARSHGLGGYYANALCFEGQVALKLGDAAAAARLLRAGVDQLRRTQSETLCTIFLSGLAEALLASGQPDEALAAANEAVRRCEDSNAFWWLPEAVRIEGEVRLRLNQPQTAQAEADFRRSLDLARNQGALSWELRAAASLARILQGQNRPADAKDILRPVYRRFTEGFGTADLQSAKALLDALGLA